MFKTSQFNDMVINGLEITFTTLKMPPVRVVGCCSVWDGVYFSRKSFRCWCVVVFSGIGGYALRRRCTTFQFPKKRFSAARVAANETLGEGGELH